MKFDVSCGVEMGLKGDPKILMTEVSLARKLREVLSKLLTCQMSATICTQIEY